MNSNRSEIILYSSTPMTIQQPQSKAKPAFPPIAYIGAGILLIGMTSFGWQTVSHWFAPTPQLVGDRTSIGDYPLLPNPENTDAKEGSKAFALKNFSAATTFFEEALRKNANDPETRIYLNNAKSMEQGTLKIAVSIPASTDVNGSKEVLRGVAQAQQEVNDAGGIGGKKLIVMLANDDSDTQVAQQLAQTFVDNKDILGVVGHLASSVTLATAPIYDQGKLPLISPVSSAVQLSNKSPYVFRTVPSDYTAARSLGDYMLNHLRLKKAVVYFNSSSDYSKSLKGEFNTAIALQGGQVVTEFDLSDSGFNPRTSLEQARQKGAEVIMLASNTGMLDKALQVVQLNQKQLPILGGDDIYSPKTLDIGREQGLGLTVAIPWHSLGGSSADFSGRASKLWGGAQVNWRTVTAYDAVQSFIVALKKQPNPSREGVQSALASRDFSAQGASSVIQFLPSGDRNSTIQLVSITKGNRSGFGYDFVPIQTK
jgi:branched-chain amino acid transport system substrate-binding protein